MSNCMRIVRSLHAPCMLGVTTKSLLVIALQQMLCSLNTVCMQALYTVFVTGPNGRLRDQHYWSVAASKWPVRIMLTHARPMYTVFRKKTPPFVFLHNF